MPTSFVSKGKRALFKAVILLAAFVVTAQACIWDGDTLEEDIKKNPTLADAILNPRPPQVDSKKLEERLKELLAKRNEANPEWWNNVAGTYLRLGRAKEAAELLEPVVNRFENDYGIHANLGTAYHLLGKYEKAEKHIARDLELKPDAHFGLEKYHLALLQYLAKPKEYQARHVYIDELTWAIFEPDILQIRPIPLEGLRVRGSNHPVAELEAELRNLAEQSEPGAALPAVLLKLAQLDEAPAYAGKYELVNYPKFQEGVIYMATLNPKEPACMIMLGMAALRNRDLNLAKKAFEKAVLMGSPLEKVLKLKIGQIDDHVKEAEGHSSPPDDLRAMIMVLAVLVVAGCAFSWAVVSSWRKMRPRDTTET